ncbi:cation:proton antiporter [Nannocystaceae bacterium ST9]
MEGPGLYLAMIGGLFLLGAAGELIFARTRIPDVVWMILAGIGLRMFGVLDPAALDPVMPLFSALTLIVVLFEGGRQIVVQELIQLAPRASALALVGFMTSMIVVAIITQLAAWTGLLPASWTFSHSLMVGAILGGSSSLIIMPAMSLAKVDSRVSTLVGLESSLTDALCVVVAVALMGVVLSGGSGAGGSGTLFTLAKTFGIGLAFGLGTGWCWFPVLRMLSGSRYAYPITFAALLFLYALVDRLGGSPAIAVLTFSVVVGNADSLMKRMGFSLGDRPLALDDSVVTVHTQAAFFIKSFFFTYIGLLLAPPWSLLILGLVCGLGLFVARLPAAALIARPPAFDRLERRMIAISLPRGMAAGVLATLPGQMGIPDMQHLPALVFAAIVTSIALFAVGFRDVYMPASPPVPAELPPTSASATANPLAGAFPDGSLPHEPVAVGLAIRKPLPAHEPPVVIPDLVDAMPDGSLPRVDPVRKLTAHGLPMIMIEPPSPEPSDVPTPPATPITTMLGLPAVEGGPPKPEAQPGPGPLFVPPTKK